MQISPISRPAATLPRTAMPASTMQTPDSIVPCTCTSSALAVCAKQLLDQRRGRVRSRWARCGHREHAVEVGVRGVGHPTASRD